MKNLLKIIGIIALTAVIGFTVISCGGSGLSGTYVNEDIADWSLTFSGKKITQSFLGESAAGTFSVKDGSITMTFDGISSTSKYTLEGNKFIMTESGMTLTFIKK